MINFILSIFKNMETYYHGSHALFDRFDLDHALEGEKAATAFLLSIGVELIEWPYNWKNPALGTNRAVLDDSMVRIKRVDSIKLDDKKKLIEASITQIR